MGVSVAVVRFLASALEHEGLSHGAFLAEAGLSLAELGDVRDQLDEARYERLITGACAATGQPALGLGVARHAPLSGLPLLGALIMGCSTLRDAVAAFLRHAHLLGRGGAWSLAEQGDEAIFAFELGLAAPLSARFSAECVATLAARASRHFEPTLRPRAVRFAHSAPAYAHRYTELFGCAVQFGAHDNALVFTRAALDSRNAFADQELCANLEAIAQRVSLTQNRHNTAERVRDLLRYRGDFDGFGARHIARGVGLSESALRRRLAATGCNVTSLVEEARVQAACDALRRADCNIKELAEALGYSQASAFHRAFKRWTGMTPRAYARRHAPTSLGSLAQARAARRDAAGQARPQLSAELGRA